MAQEYFAQVSPGLEELLRQELKRLGARKTSIQEGAVEFQGTRKHVYRVLLQSRLASRVYWTIATGSAPNAKALFERVVKAPWKSIFNTMGDPISLAVRVSVSASPAFGGTGEVEQLVRAGVDRALGNERVNHCEWVDEGPHRERLLVRVHQQRITLRLDCSGSLLHHRGWRRVEGKAPLRPTLAAAMLELLKWNKEEPLIDPMCGSGTIPIEAVRCASGRSPRLWNSYACHRWQVFDQAVWEAERASLTPEPTGEVLFNNSIYAIDRSTEAISQTQQHLNAAGALCHVSVGDVNQLLPPSDVPGLILVNPPYGLRVAEGEGFKTLLKRFAMDERWFGWRLGFIYPRQLTPPMLPELEMTELARFQHGGLPVWVWRCTHRNT